MLSAFLIEGDIVIGDELFPARSFTDSGDKKGLANGAI